MRPTVLITGAGGQLGIDLIRAFADWHVVALNRQGLDVTDADACRLALYAHRPNAVVHAAAFTAVDRCETEPALAIAVHRDGTTNVAAAAASVGAALVVVSTDYVFNGWAKRPYTESDRTDPQSVYGASKLAAEVAAFEYHPAPLIVRTAWLAGVGGNNIVKTILHLAADPLQPLAFVTDQLGSPTTTIDLAALIAAAAADELTGIAHGVNRGQATWWELARFVLDQAGHSPDRVRAITTSELQPPRPAPRPPDSRLATERHDLSRMAPWTESFARLIRVLQA